MSCAVRELQSATGPQLLCTSVPSDRLRKKRVASALYGRCDLEHEQIQCLSDSHLHHTHIHTLRVCKSKARSNCSSHVHTISQHTILFPRHFTNCPSELCG